jgi:hypothetical protein
MPKGTRQLNRLDDGSNLCVRCLAIDRDQIFDQHVQDGFDDDGFVLDLGMSVHDLETSPCVLCNLFGSVGPKKSVESETSNCHLRRYSARVEFTDLEEPIHAFIYGFPAPFADVPLGVEVEDGSSPRTLSTRAKNTKIRG